MKHIKVIQVDLMAIEERLWELRGIINNIQRIKKDYTATLKYRKISKPTPIKKRRLKKRC
jgi:hypothetical protein